LAKTDPAQPTLPKTSAFFDLPPEIRVEIYIFALPRWVWMTMHSDKFEQEHFPRGIGDPSGFYYPFSRDLVVLRVNRQMRQEALPFAYRRTVFHLDNLDRAIKFLVAVGETGRDNIESLHFAWESTSDSACKYETHPIPKIAYLTLRHLRLRFDSELLRYMAPRTFMADPGIQSLCSLQGVKKFEMWDLEFSPFEHSNLAQWLKGEVERGAERNESEKIGQRKD
jgi:hypothetical protein